MFNLTLDPAEPELTICICGDPRERRGICGGNPDEYEAVSFTFGGGASSHGWAPATVFALLKSGDVVALCPLVPGTTPLERERLEILDSETKVEWDSAGDSATHARRARWIRDALSNRHTAARPVKIQGPYSIWPEKESRDIDTYTYTDITCIEGEVFPLLVVAAQEGLLVYMVTDPPAAAWKVDGVR